jgi:O-antigen/teichoic acid export membrane protein
MSQLVSNARWLALAQIAKVGLQLISITVLARLLEPKYYGIMAISNSVTAFAGLFRDLGTTAALIQSREATEEIKSTAFWITTTMGSALFLIVLAIAYPAAQYFKEPDLFWVLVILSTNFPISALGAVHATMLEREGRFRELTFLEVFTQATSLAIAATLALSGFGVYSLVAPSIVACIISTLYLYRAYDWRPTRRVSKTSLQSLAKFSANLTGFNLINYFSRNADTLIIGRMLGSVALGVYSTAMKLMLFPLQSITYVSNRALYPVLSQAQADPEGFRKLYLQTISFVSLITFPMMVGLWVTRHEFVSVAYGNKWAGMIDIIAWLAPVGLLQSINSTTGTVFMAKGKTDVLFKIGIYSAILQVGAFFLGATQGVIEVTKYYFIANILAAVPSVLIVMKLIDATPKNGLGVLMPAAIASMAMGGACMLVQLYTKANLQAYSALPILVAVGVTSYALCINRFFPDSWAQLLSAVRRR